MRAPGLILAMLGAVALESGAARQDRRPRADLTPRVETAPARPGKGARLSLLVELPAGIHVQAHDPRDPTLIPTTLTLETPDGVRVTEIVYPPPSELAQTGRPEKLMVLGPKFTIDVRLDLVAGVPPGDVPVRGRLRYQACNDTVCFPPATAAVVWTMHVGSALHRSRPPAPRRHDALRVCPRLSATRR